MKLVIKLKFNGNYPEFLLISNSCFYRDENDYGKIEHKKLSIIKKFDSRISFFKLNDHFIYLFYGNENKLYDVKSNEFMDLGILSNYRIAEGSNSTIFRLANKNVPETLLFDFYKRQTIWKHNKYFSFQILDKKLLIETEKKGAISYDFQSGNCIWHYYLPETYDWQRRVASIEKPYEASKAEIEKILGVYEGIVYFVLNSGRVVGLDVDTGIELFTKVEPDSITIAYDKERIYTPTILWQNTQLDVEKGVIFGLLGNFYAEIDLKDPSRTYRVFDMDYSNNTKRIKCTNWGVCIGEEIFFAETNFAREPATVGIFNRKTKQVTWTSDMLGEEGDFRGLKKLDYANEHLYVLDNENTLHIFNRN